MERDLNQNPYLERTLRYSVGTLAVLVTIFALFGIRGVIAAERVQLRNDHEQGLSRIEVALADSLEQSARDAVSLQSALDTRGSLQAQQVEDFNRQQITSLLLDNLNTYRAIRFFDLTGNAILEADVDNLFVNIAIGEEASAGTAVDVQNDLGFQAIAQGGLQQPILGQISLEAVRASSDTEPVASIYAPLISNGRLRNIIQIEMRLNPTILSVIETATQSFVNSQNGRRVLLLEADSVQGPRILADNAPSFPLYQETIDDSSENLSLDSLYTSVVDTIAAASDDLTVRWPILQGDNNIYSVSILSPEDLRTGTFQIVIVDNALIYYAPTVLIILVIALLSVLGSMLAAWGLRRVLTTTLQPIIAAERRMQELGAGHITQMATDPSYSANPLLQTVQQVSERLDTLDQALEQEAQRRTRDLQVAGRIGRESASQSDLELLVKRAINLICNELGFYHAQVFLMDDLGEYAVLRFSRGEAGQRLLEQGHRLRVGSETIIGRVTDKRAVVVVNDTIADTDSTAQHGFNPVLPDTRAEIGLPLTIGEELLGVLDIQSLEKNAFVEEDIPTYQLLADQLAIAVYNAQLRSEADRRLSRIESLNRQATRDAWESNRSRVALQEEYGSSDTQGTISAPISVRGEVIGMLEAELDQSTLTDGDRMILNAVAERMALALENARLFQQTELTLAETSVLYDLSQQLNEAETLDDVLRAIIDTVVVDAFTGQIWLFEDMLPGEQPEEVVIQVDLAQSLRQQSQSVLGQRFNMAGEPFLHGLSSTNTDLIERVADVETMSERLRAIFTQIEAVSVAFIPLNMRGIWKGFLSLCFANERQLSELDQRLFNALVDQAGVSIDNRLLLQQTERALSRQEKLYAASRIINTQRDLSDLVYAAVATTSEPSLDFALGLLEGPSNDDGWPSYSRIIAISHKGSISASDERHRLNVTPPSPMLQREPEIINDLQQMQVDSSVDAAWLEGLGYRFVALFPLYSDNEPSAIFYIFNAEPYELSMEDYEVYRAQTGQMSTQIQNRRLLARTEEALNETTRLYVATRAIASAQDMTSIYDTVAGHLAMPFIQQASADSDIRIIITLLLTRQTTQLDAPELELVYEWKSDELEASIANVGMTLPRTVYPFGQLLEEHDEGTLVYADVMQAFGDERMLLDFLTRGGTSSVAIAPLWSRRQWFGVLLLRTDSPDLLTSSYSRFMQAIADQIAIAIERQRLLQETEYERSRLNTILSTLPTGVMVLDAETLIPVQHNERATELLGSEISYDEPFSAQDYNMYRTGTNLPYPNEELPIYQARRLNRQVLGDDIAIIQAIGQTDLLISAAPIDSLEGNPRSIVVAVQDISALRSMENTMQENLRETVLLYETQRTLSEANTLDELFDNLIMQLAMQQPTDAHLIFYDDEADNLELVRSMVQPLKNVEALQPILTPEMVNLDDVQRSAGLDDAVREVFADAGVRSVLILPLRSRMRLNPLGWLLLVEEAPEAFTIDQERTIGSVADMASAAIETSFLVASTQDALQETASLYNAATTISRSRDFDELFGAVEAALLTLEPDMYAGFLVSGDGLQEMFKVGFAAAEASGLSFERLLDLPLPQREGTYIADISRATLGEFELEILKGGEIHAFAAVNLRASDGRGGRLLVGYKRAYRFNEGAVRFMNAVADSASVVIDNQLLLDQVQNTLQETSMLYQASKALLEIAEPDEIIEVIVNFLIEPHVNQVFIGLLSTPRWDAPRASLDVVASWQMESDVDLLGVSLSADQFPAWNLLSTEQVFTVNDVYDENENLDTLDQTSIESLDARSLVIIPLRVPNRAIGIIWIGSREPYRYTDSNLRIYQAFAEQTSLTLEANYLLDQTERRARQMETSAVISQSIGTILDLDYLLPSVVELIKEQFEYDQVQVFLMDDDNRWAMLHASTGEPGEQLLEIEHKLERGSKSVIGQVTELGEVSIALDTADANVIHKPNPYLPLTRSEMAMPLFVQGEVVGALDVQSNHPNAFSEEDIQALTTLAAQISVAIDNARLYEETDRRAQELEFLFNVATDAAAANTLDASLQTIADRVRETVRAHSVAIFLPQIYRDYRGNTKTQLEVTAMSADADVTIAAPPIDLDTSDNLLGQVALAGVLRTLPDLADEPNYTPLASEARTAMLVPIGTNENLAGLMVLENIRPDSFETSVRTLMLTLSSSLRAIVQNSLLLEQLEETVEQLREVDRLKSEFLASMSHELRTPLNSIIGFSRVMLKGISGPLTEMQEQDLNTIYGSGNHLLNLINDILDQAKIEANELNLRFGYFDIKPMVESVKSMAIGLMKEKPLTLNVEIAPNLPQAYGDEFRSRQILLNVVTNAIKFTNEGSVTVQAYTVDGEEGPMLRLDVIDTGIGIEEQDFSTLFEQFRQVDNSLTRTVGGTGLGLPISRSLAEMQGGELAVESEVGVGSTFSILIPTYEGAKEALEQLRQEARDERITRASSVPGILTRSNSRDTAEVEQASQKSDTIEVPVADENANGHGPSANGQKPSSRPKPVMPKQRLVLLIEDNKDMVDRFRRTLQQKGYEVSVADFFPETMVGQMRPAVVVLDVNFNDGQGWQLLENLKERDDTFDIPIVVTTMATDSERAYRLGAHSFIQRPFESQQLVDAVLDAERKSQRERIVIIDDQPEAIRLLTQLLAEHGDFAVFSAQDGDEGISLVARRHPDLIILDLRMPGKDGFAVLDELRGNPETAKIPVLVVTGDVDLNSTELSQLENIRILHKTDISQEEYDQFIDNVRSYLEAASD